MKRSTSTLQRVDQQLSEKFNHRVYGIHRSKGYGLLAPVLLLLFSGLVTANEAGTDGRTEPVVIEIDRLSPDAGRGVNPDLIAPSVPGLAFFFHDGSIDYFDVGKPASGAFRDRLIAGGAVGRDTFGSSTPWRGLIAYPRPVRQLWIMNYPVSKIYLNPEDHRYLSFGGKFFPSDDAFVGNDDPKAHPLFDENGNFLGPVVIEIYGRDVFDGGVRPNDEQGIPYWDIETEPSQPSPPYEGPVEEKPIRPHPGYNGSEANPDGEPVIFLSELDSEKADFTRGDYPLARIRLTSGLDASFSGNWYNPEHAGEGFVFDVTTNEEDEKLLVVDWFTYGPGDKGRQLWLHGMGKMRDGVGNPDEFKVKVDLIKTRGGRFASEENPESVEHVPWGSVTLQFIDCDKAIVSVEPDRNAFNRDPYLISRISAPPVGTEHWCTKDREWSANRFQRVLGVDPLP